MRFFLLPLFSVVLSTPISQWPLIPFGSSSVVQPIISCGVDTDVFIPKKILVSPDPPVRGQSITLTIEGTLSEDVVDGAYADIKVKLGLIKLLETKVDLCSEIKNVDLTCPLKEGELTIVKQVDIPNEVPPGVYKVHVAATNADELSIACFDITIQL
ncbi:Phosphatidylglycerol/phosphatidylinositol transfer protein [Clydaea vesicula]|uniref:Phosphatidylglycerol/phosphatidylinositol transfer protein n=1 Tax=Clydaea vesicula TaxID=447962 RepID=A0AAD5TWS7_9FUNG|nr:Phosphatidylglycerol/phosphatidylinositol transfer protein [Clydaea vesicula]KAJ3386736.1 Phosphatidylglycerol/phosphatidylinositol transfer protein [Lobulomyces angularis]